MAASFSSLTSFDAVFVAIGQLYAEEVLFREAIENAIVAPVDFAAKPKGTGGKKKNCNPAKSHFCQSPNGSGSCVPLGKKCRFAPGATVTQASNATGKGKAKNKSSKASSTSAAPTAPAKSPQQQDIESLAAALDNNDWDAAADVADRVYERAKSRAVNDAEFYDGIKAGNGATEDFILKEIYASNGFDGKPRKVTAQEIDDAYENGATIAYRAMGSSQDRFKQHFDNFKNGDYFAGHGIYGHGTYVAYASNTTGHTREMAAKSASSYGSGVMRMTFADDMNVVFQTENQADFQQVKARIDRWATQQRSRVQPSDDEVKAVTIEVNTSYKPTAYTPSYLKGSNLGIQHVSLTPRGRGSSVDNIGRISKVGGAYTYRTADGAQSGTATTRKEAMQALVDIHILAEARKRNPESQRVESRIKRLRSVVIGDEFTNETSGRLAAIRGYDAIALDAAYDPSYMNLLNRSKVNVQKTRGRLGKA
jgi:hypothetical protein